METALIVEDDPDQAALASRLISLRDLRPLVTASGREGLRLARRLQPEIILLDVRLPDSDGFDICRRLRSDPRTRNTPIVMVTGMDEARDRRKGYRVGANAYVTKPYSPDDLFDAIASAQAWRQNLSRGKVQGEIQVELNSESSLLLEVNEFLAGICRETPLGVDQIAQLRQAIMEMGQNAIEWGNRHQEELLVKITYRSFEDRVEVIIRDEGPGFDPKSLPHAASADDPMAHMDVREKLGLREGGFGLMISRGMLDVLRYNAEGNEVTLIKRFDPDSQVAPS